jgi:hypothetical protein
MVIFSPTGLSLTSDNYQEKGGVESKYETMDFVAAPKLRGRKIVEEGLEVSSLAKGM